MPNAIQLRHARLLLAVFALSFSAAAQVYFAPAPGVARVTSTAQTITLGNAVVQATWSISGEAIRGGEVRDLIAHRDIAAQASPFVLLLKDGTAVSVGNMKMTSAPKIADLPPHPDASSAA